MLFKKALLVKDANSRVPIAFMVFENQGTGRNPGQSIASVRAIGVKVILDFLHHSKARQKSIIGFWRA